MREPSGSAPQVSETDIRAILTDAELLALVCQPIVDVRRGFIVGYEVLSRFKLPSKATPDVVFAAAAKVGLAEELEALVVGRALSLSRRTPQDCFLSINVDPNHITSDRVFGRIREHGALGGLVFEMTEQNQMNDLPKVASYLEEIRKLGGFIAMDDAGAGYSGLQQLLALRPQFLKLDRALVSDIHEDEAKRAMVQMLGELSQRLDAWIIAEGIEHAAELHVLAQLGVPLVQGYCLARPGPPWVTLDEGVKTLLTSLPQNASWTGSIDDLIEPCIFCDMQSPWPANDGIAIRLEVGGRPVAMRVGGEDGVQYRSSHELLRVKRGNGMSAVALRSTARPERYRWDPLVCVDDSGSFEGVIQMHRLVWALASRERAKSAGDDEVYGLEPPMDKRH